MLQQLSPADQPFMRSTSTVYGTSVSSPNRHRQLATSIPRMHYPKILILTLLLFVPWVPTILPSVHAQTTPASSNVDDPEAVIRLLVEANANKDLATMKKYMGGDPQGVGYTIGGRKFVGWEELARAMEIEFRTVEQLIIPITDLQVWQRQNIAWFAMELDYTRVTKGQNGLTTTVIPLRETGVLERREGSWQLVNWHESLQKPMGIATLTTERPSTESFSKVAPNTLDLSGVWEIQEEDKSYQATLNAEGSGSYTQEQGVFTTTQIDGRLWSGTWEQKGNDREGGFEVLLSEDYTTAEGVWWYTRVEEHKNIPPRIYGGSYFFKRIGPMETQETP